MVEIKVDRQYAKFYSKKNFEPIKENNLIIVLFL